jgi:integrase
MANQIKSCKTCGIEFRTNDNIVNCELCRQPYGREDRGLKDVLGTINNKQQRETLQRWANERIANGCKIVGTVTRLYTLRKFCDVLKKPFEKVTREDVTSLLAHNGFGKVYYKKLIKNFFKWVHGTEEYPDCVRWIKIKRTVDEIKPEKKVLTDEEILKILNATVTQRDRTILQILSENPTRPRDICNLKVGDVIIDEYGFELQMKSKTASGSRTIRLIHSVPDLKMYLNTHPYKDNPKAPLFFQISTNRFGEPLGWGGVNGMLQRAVKRSGLKRKVNLYDFRRSSTTKLLQDPRYTPEEVKVMGGWSSIRMFDTYGKVTSEMVNEKKLKANGLIKDKKQLKEDLLKPVSCPRCQEQNPATSVSCSKCWLPLKKETIELKEKVVASAIKKQKPLNKDTIKELIKDMIRKGEISI